MTIICRRCAIGACLRVLGGETQHRVKWSVTEEESPLPNLVIEQIQQDVTLFSFNGKTFTLAARDDWPGGIIEDGPQGE